MQNTCGICNEDAGGRPQRCPCRSIRVCQKCHIGDMLTSSPHGSVCIPPPDVSRVELFCDRPLLGGSSDTSGRCSFTRSASGRRVVVTDDIETGDLIFTERAAVVVVLHHARQLAIPIRQKLHTSVRVLVAARPMSPEMIIATMCKGKWLLGGIQRNATLGCGLLHSDESVVASAIKSAGLVHMDDSMARGISLSSGFYTAASWIEQVTSDNLDDDDMTPDNHDGHNVTLTINSLGVLEVRAREMLHRGDTMRVDWSKGPHDDRVYTDGDMELIKTLRQWIEHSHVIEAADSSIFEGIRRRRYSEHMTELRNALLAIARVDAEVTSVFLRKGISSAHAYTQSTQTGRASRGSWTTTDLISTLVCPSLHGKIHVKSGNVIVSWVMSIVWMIERRT